MADAGKAAPKLGTVVVASAAGTAFEWYDFFVFGSLAAVIARHFFADAGETVAYIMALLTFGLGFVVRPLGAFAKQLRGEVELVPAPGGGTIARMTFATPEAVTPVDPADLGTRAAPRRS